MGESVVRLIRLLLSCSLPENLKYFSKSLTLHRTTAAPSMIVPSLTCARGRWKALVEDERRSWKMKGQTIREVVYALQTFLVPDLWPALVRVGAKGSRIWSIKSHANLVCWKELWWGLREHKPNYCVATRTEPWRWSPNRNPCLILPFASMEYQHVHASTGCSWEPGLSYETKHL